MFPAGLRPCPAGADRGPTFITLTLGRDSGYPGTLFLNLDDIQTVHELILASSSPRRRELLSRAGYRFRVVTPHESAECGVCSGETPPEMVARLAYQKAADVAARVEHGLLLGCDTVAECMGHILGKPADENRAREMLELLSGREHHVYSGLCLWRVPGGEPLVEVDCTTLVMRRLSSRELDDYLASGLWEGKAGAFGWQDRLGWLRIVEGSESNVVGLPLERLADMLKRYQSTTEPSSSS